MLTKPLRVAVVGVGHMGKHHVRVYKKLQEMGLCRLVGVADVKREHAEVVARENGLSAFGSSAELVGEAEAVSIAVPTVYHESVAEPLLKAGIACLIEKPLADDSATAERLVQLAEKHKALLTVGHIERFNPVVQAIAKRGIRPRFIETHRISPFTFRSADVSVVLDMMIHDIDVVLKLLGGEPEEVDAVGVAVIGKVEDVASARLKFRDGSVADLTASRLAIKTERKIRCFAPELYASMDYQKKTGLAITKAANIDLLEKVREMAGPDGDLGALAFTGMDYTRLVNVEPLIVEERDQLELELESFLKAVNNGQAPVVTAQDGLAAVRTAERIITSCRAHKWT